MSVDFIVGIMAEAIKVTLLMSLPVLVVGLVVGLVISLFQAVTQIQEMTLSFIPKILAMGVALVLFGPWMLHTTVAFTSGLLIDLPQYIR